MEFEIRTVYGSTLQPISSIKWTRNDSSCAGRLKIVWIDVKPLGIGWVLIRRCASKYPICLQSAPTQNGARV